MALDRIRNYKIGFEAFPSPSRKQIGLTDLEGLKGASGSKIVILAIGTGLLAAGILAYLTGVMTVNAVSYACRVQGIPCPEREGATLSMGQMEELWGAVSIVAGAVLAVLGLGSRIRSTR